MIYEARLRWPEDCCLASDPRSALIALCAATFRALTLIPLTFAASLNDNSRNFSSSMALPWRVGSTITACLTLHRSPHSLHRPPPTPAQRRRAHLTLTTPV